MGLTLTEMLNLFAVSPATLVLLQGSPPLVTAIAEVVGNSNRCSVAGHSANKFSISVKVKPMSETHADLDAPDSFTRLMMRRMLMWTSLQNV